MNRNSWIATSIACASLGIAVLGGMSLATKSTVSSVTPKPPDLLEEEYLGTIKPYCNVYKIEIDGVLWLVFISHYGTQVVPAKGYNHDQN